MLTLSNDLCMLSTVCSPHLSQVTLPSVSVHILSLPNPTLRKIENRKNIWISLISNLGRKKVNEKRVVLVTESKLLIWCHKTILHKNKFYKNLMKNHASLSHLFPYFVFSLSNLPFSRQTRWEVSASPVSQSNSIEIRYSDFICRKSKSRADRVSHKRVRSCHRLSVLQPPVSLFLQNWRWVS